MLEFRILGTLEVARDGAPIDLGARQRRMLLTVLLLEAGSAVSVDRIVDALWGATPPASARPSLQAIVADTRRLLGDRDAQILRTVTPGYLIDVGEQWFDLSAFEDLLTSGMASLRGGDAAAARGSLEEASALWRGRPLADVDFEDFASAPAARLEELRLVCEEGLAESEIALGLPERAIPRLASLVSDQPLRERARELHLEALARAGRGPEALTAYEDWRVVLRDELGLEPAPSVRRLHLAIVRGEIDAPREHPPATRRRAVLAAARTGEELRQIAALVAPLTTEGAGRDLILLCIGTPEGDPDAALARAREQGEEAASALRDGEVQCRFAAALGPQLVPSALGIARHQDVDLVLVAEDVSDVAEPPACDLAMLAGIGRERRPAPGSPVVVPFGSGPDDWAALELAAWMARASGTSLRIVGPSTAPGSGSSQVASAALIVQRFVGIEADARLVEPGAEGVLSASPDAGAIVLPAPSASGSLEVRRAVAAGAGCPVLTVRQGVRPSGLAPAETMTRYTWSVGGRRLGGS